MASSKWPASEILTKHRGTCTIHSGWHEFTSRPTDWLSWFTVFVAIQFSSQKLAAVTFFYIYHSHYTLENPQSSFYHSMLFSVHCLFAFGAKAPQWARASSITRFPDHTQRRTTIGKTPLDEWSASRRDLYFTTHNTHNRQTSVPPVGFEPTIISRQAAADLRLRPRGHWNRIGALYRTLIPHMLPVSVHRTFKFTVNVNHKIMEGLTKPQIYRLFTKEWCGFKN